ncbi:hypothetical protein HU200_054149 [Digitaria exilis]|uniref:O-methyltransferase n=1 Tax=Digitaria exilis TaxID=1010633 RepID=A0A835AQH7_9POAL|nr:hypothetical protein HU200_054149 [Digitaria exilis]
MKSMALKSALDLGIADAIDLHGGAATLPQILTKLDLHPSKIPSLRRLMRVLTTTKVFSIQNPLADGSQPIYALTSVSRLLIGSQTPLTAMVLNPTIVSPFFDLGAWYQYELPDPSIFKLTHGRAISLVNNGLASDSQFIVDIAIKQRAEVFQGISSLIDVGGGIGAAAQAISKAFPQVKCSVLDLDHVIAKAPADTSVQFITGDMFESIPHANAVLLKSVLHDWDHEECVKILKNCKKAIPQREAGGKVIIINIVIGAGPSDLKHKEMQAMFDVYMMFINGMERDEQQWKNIFSEAGFSDYKIVPVLGVRSIIEVYP